MSQPIGPTAPTIGCIVHVELAAVTIPAIVTAVLGSDGAIAATAFSPGGVPVPMEVEHDEAGSPGTWHWPPIR